MDVKKQYIIVKVAILILLLFIEGCSLSPISVEVIHNPLEKIENKKEGNILITQFVDKRADTRYIGHKKSFSGKVMGHIVIEKGMKLYHILTKYFAEALREAGYTVVVQELQYSNTPKRFNFDAIVNGEIIEFWETMEFWLSDFLFVSHNMQVRIRAIDPISEDVLWERDIYGEAEQISVTIPEYEDVIREALTQALNQAVKEFASDEFYIAIKKGKRQINPAII